MQTFLNWGIALSFFMALSAGADFVRDRAYNRGVRDATDVLLPFCTETKPLQQQVTGHPLNPRR